MLRDALAVAGVHPEELHEAEVVVVHVLGREADGGEQQEAPVGAGEHRGRAMQRTCRSQGSRVGMLSGEGLRATRSQGSALRRLDHAGARESKLMAAVTRGGTRLGSGCVLVVHATASNSDVSWCKLGSSWVLVTSSNGWLSESCAAVGCRMLTVEVGLRARRAWWRRASSETAALRDPSRYGVGGVVVIVKSIT